MADQQSEHIRRALDLSQRGVGFSVIGFGYGDQRPAEFMWMGAAWAHGRACNGPIYLGKPNSTGDVGGRDAD